ncbi:hypothetical protein DB30_03245 [Enhygromyxa salina]|uniref:Knr4/Smi1-like domain-containing protein n=1 Tax=Enhygromyxa salina TaxID=215803 RepID=A0A0C1ZJ56_9BACT|nr:hypothetical protein [Enhygromyxa salina]KIG17544.1 hypothetical protein DB30_03245 [Enhygromyxa salina]
MLSANDWQQIIAFIDERDPGFRGRIRGATPERIQELQAIHAAKLPRAYVDFLELMGEDHGGFELSWAHYSTVQELLLHKVMPPGGPTSYPQSRFIRIAGLKEEHEDDASGWGDYYLDLQRGERDDPVMIDHEFFDPYVDAPEVGSVVVERFTDRVQLRAYADYEQLNNAHQYALNLHFSTPKIAAGWQQLLRLFRWMGWQACLPGSEGTWFGQHTDPVSLEAEIYNDTCVCILAGSNDRRRVLALIEEIKDEFPTQNNGGKWFIGGDKV